MIVAYLLFVLFSSIVEGFLWDRKGRNGQGLENIHLWLVLMRCTVWFMLFVLTRWEVVAFAVFSFPLIHDGIYYKTRNLLNGSKYPKGFFDVSKDSTAKITLNFKNRSFMFVFAVLFLLF